MSEILDNFEKEKKKNFGKKSFRYFVISSISLFILLGTVFLWMTERVNSPNPILSLTFYSFLAFSISGFINGIRSYKSKEPPSKMKNIAIIGNTILVCLIFGYFIYSYENILRIFTTPIERVENFD
jgi:hypothetical protein